MNLDMQGLELGFGNVVDTFAHNTMPCNVIKQKQIMNSPKRISANWEYRHRNREIPCKQV